MKIGGYGYRILIFLVDGNASNITETCLKWHRVRCVHCMKDRELLEPVLIPVVIIGSKYDVFQVTHFDVLFIFALYVLIIMVMLV